MYLAGLYHRAGRNETNELINVPDIIGMDIELDGINFTLLSGEIIDWQRGWILPMANCVVAWCGARQTESATVWKAAVLSHWINCRWWQCSSPSLRWMPHQTLC